MKIVVLAPFAIIPPTFGGAERIYNLAKSLEPVTVIALNWEGSDNELTVDGITYRLIGVDPEAVEQSKKLVKLGISTYDGMPFFTRNNQKKLKQAIAQEAPDLIVLEHPWLVPFVGDTSFVYDSHNAEAHLTAERWPNSIDAQVVYELEKEAITKAKKITVCSVEDAKILKALYKPQAEMHLIPNGTDIPAKPSEGKTKNLLFIGSIYGPNIRAAQELANLAKLLPDYTIQIVGACATQVISNAPNVQLLGPVSEEDKDRLFANAYAFVNLMLQGSGTNLKNARAMAYGLPVIATTIGARGFPTAIQVKKPAEVAQVLANLDWRKESEKNLEFAKSISWKELGAVFKGLVYAALQ